MRHLFSFSGTISPAAYLVAAPALLLSQHAAVAAVFSTVPAELVLDAGFWLLPLRRLSQLPHFPPAAAAFAFMCSLAVAWGLALLSFRRAAWSRNGYGLAALAVVPAVQFAAVATLAVLARRQVVDEVEPERGRDKAHIVQGLLAGVAIIVAAVLVSAVSFGAYGWGLFVGTPFMAGLATGYLANRRVALPGGETIALVVGSGLLGTLALLMLALEGVMCILLVVPLAAIAAIIGGAFGRAVALAAHHRGKPLMSVALLPAVFALEAAMPPMVPIEVVETTVVAASPGVVWRSLIAGEPIALPPGLVGLAGLAYPTGSRLRGEGVGAERIGLFSTGPARERISEWAPGRRLSFVVLEQPPAMEEMSPYRRVHAPHVSGYFETRWTRFELDPLPGGRTRVTVRAAHRLRIDPAPYWEPIARWAIHLNVSRVLQDLKVKSERAR